MPQLTCWIISDDSHRQVQSEALAAQLTDSALLVRSHECKNEGYLESLEAPAPDIIITTGEEGAVYLDKIKTAFKGKPVTVHITAPNTREHKADLYIISEHENIHNLKGNNVITTIGILNKISQVRLDHVADHFDENIFPQITERDLPKPWVAVLLGGKYVGGDITPEHMERLAHELNQIDASYLITSSPRTPLQTLNRLTQHLHKPYIYYDWKNPSGVNPYQAMLALSDSIIVTGDSVRMCSEACSTGKPTYIFAQDMAEPYQTLHHLLYKHHSAAPFEHFMHWPYSDHNALNEAEKVSCLIKQRFFAAKNE